jgi:hypothetical protein
VLSLIIQYSSEDLCKVIIVFRFVVLDDCS